MVEQRPSILIVDDEEVVRDSLRTWFEKDGYDTGSAVDGLDGLRKLSERSWDIALLDIKMPSVSGMELLHRVREIDPDIVCIMITAYASVETAVEALKAGAFDYVVKPVDPDDLTRIVRRAVEKRRLTKENLALRTQIEALAPEEDLIGDSPAMQRVREMISSVAQTEASVLIRGESGTGKELVARLIHAQSPARFCPLVPVHCGALPESLLESELFGHEKGAFTGAHHRRRGKLEIANGGTLFLDEIGTIDPRTQVDLLRVLETKQFTRIGGNQVISVEFRVIAATNQDLEQLVKEGRMREDFYYRINVFPIDVPPLRERRGDIMLCAKFFLEKFARHVNKRVTGISKEAQELLMNHSWRGNVRELKNAIERAIVVTRGPELKPEDFPMQIAENKPNRDGDTLDEIEQAHIEYILQREGWNITRSAKILGIDRVTLYNRIKKYGLSR
jgi:DNA-binding NtrC family response regulator